MLSWVLISIVVLMTGLWLLQRIRKPAPKLGSGGKRPTQREQHRWHAVRLQAGENCCEPIQHMTENIYLAAEAPPLPLPSCDVAVCHCRYQHFDDRRQDMRRDPYNQYTRLAAVYSGEERRGNRGRRQSDWLPAR